MPLGIVSDADFEEALNNLENNRPMGTVIQKAPLGRTPGAIETPECIRQIIGDNAIDEGRPDTLALGRALGISENSVAAYTAGASSLKTYNEPTDLKNFLSNRKLKIAKKASKKLLDAFDHLSDEKIGAGTATEIASVMKSLSGIVKDMIPEQNSSQPNGPAVQFVIHAPQITKESKFDVITVNE